MAYKHVIFDIDGTMLDTEYAILHSLQDTVLDIAGRKPEIEDLTFALGIPGEVALEQLGIKDTVYANKLWNDILLKYTPFIKLFDGISELLEELHKKGSRLGIVTSKTRQEFVADFDPCGVTSLFDTVICVEDSPRPKPFADPILTYLGKTGAQKEEVIYIGDTVYDFQCAENAGVDFGLAVWGSNSKETIHAKYFFDNPKCVLKTI